MYLELLEIKEGDRVVCDFCAEDWSERDESGGFQFASKVSCPSCEEEMLRTIKEYDEEKYIRSKCPKELSFKDWVLTLR